MKRILLMFLVLMVLTSTLSAQNISLFDVDATGFPTIKAKFFAFDKDGKQITSLTPGSFELKENGQPRTVTNVSCPAPQPPQALSSVLTIDVSGSMGGGNINLAKEAARAWIEGLPLGKSECAISSFDHVNYLNQDFTTDKNKLLTAINNLSAMGGTDYDAALINPLAGGLLVTKNGKQKRVIVFLSDGLPNQEPNTSKIIQDAKQQNVTIYGVTLGMTCPQNIKDITTKTGGQWFENVTTVEQAKQIYQQILQTAQGKGDPCTIEWQSETSCTEGITNVELRITSINITATTSYQSPNTSVAKLEFEPPSIKFMDLQVGVKTEQKVTVTARNSNFTVTNITSNNAGFEILPKSFVLNAGQSTELTVSYLPADSGYNHCRFEFENDRCLTRYYVSGGWKGKMPTIRTIKLIHPNGGEVFVAGSDTVITWEGVSPDEAVRLEYRTDDNNPWIIVTDSARGLSYNWKIPKTPSNQCLARVTANAKSNIDNEMVLIPAGTFQMGNTGAYSGYSDEKPIHKVTISKPFYLSKYEITQQQYVEVMGSNPSNFKGEDLPVAQVSWNESVEFCNKLSEREGLQLCYSGSSDSIVCDWNANGYRLPTEAEWEYACKGGTTTDFYSGSLSNSECTPLDANLDKVGWYCGNENTKAREVGLKDPNSFGLYDMNGNVWEWCWDWFDYYSSAAVTDPIGTSSGSYRVLRGGSWNDNARDCRGAARSYNSPRLGTSYYGFRICRNY